MIPPPMVSVSIITYNHEDYIAKALDSVLGQQTDFNFEIIVGDDFSTDATREIVKGYQRKYPNKIYPILHPERYRGIPGRLNNITNIYACRGKYVALLDGDDYWCNNGKLQLQVDFMEANSEYVAVANEAMKVTENGTSTGGYYSEHSSISQKDNSFTQENVLQAAWCLTQTSSLLFINKVFGEFPDWFWNIVSADYGLLLLLSQHGKIKYFKEPYTAYRIHDNSFTAQHYLSKKMFNLKIKELQLFRKLFLPYRFHSSLSKNLRVSHSLNKRIAIFKYAYAAYIKREGNRSAAIGYLIKASFSNFSLFFFSKIAVKKLLFIN